MTKKIWEEINFFLMVAHNFLQTKIENRETKLAHAITRVTKSLMRPAKKRTQMIEDIEVELAIEEDGKLLRDEKGALQFSRANELKRLKRIRAIDDMEFEFQTHWATSLPEDLSQEEKNAFEGFVIEPATSQSNGGTAGTTEEKVQKKKQNE